MTDPKVPEVGRVERPTWVSDCSRATVINGDCVDVMADLPANSVDAIVCDPPYGLEFMGQEWDRLGDVRQPFLDEIDRPDNPYGRTPVRYGGGQSYGQVRQVENEGRDNPYGRSQVEYGTAQSYGAGSDDRWTRMQEWHKAWSEQALRVLKPGGHLLAFGGSRTFHRLVVAVEDAGFEVRDVLMWLYGTGFPKSKNLTDEWQGWGSALKPAYEPVVMARKPMIGSLAKNMQVNGVGALNIDAARIATTDRFGGGAKASSTGNATVEFAEGYEAGDGWVPGDEGGRWPANVLMDEDAAAALDEQTGVTRGGISRACGPTPEDRVAYNGMGAPRPERGYEDQGGASRFFYVAKADKQERQRGLYGRRNNHPTVKPAEVMRYLIRLVVPRGALVLDPFTGSGSTGLACLDEMVRFVGIERSTEYFDLACARIGGLADSTLDFGAAS